MKVLGAGAMSFNNMIRRSRDYVRQHEGEPSMAQKVIPHLWFDHQAEEAAEYYVALFHDSRILGMSRYPDAGQDQHGQAAGAVMNVEFELAGFSFLAINAGPLFTINPSISFILNFDPSMIENAASVLDEYWNRLSDGGQAFMELGEYPFSPKYGWVQDRFGVSWQLMQTDPAGEDRPFVVPELMFTGGNTNRATEAIEFYTSIIDNSLTGHLEKYPEANGNVEAGALMFGEFMIGDVWFAAMDSPIEHNFGFNEAISLSVTCENQKQIDYLWDKLSAVPEAERCGWLKDRFGVSWQITPAGMGELMNSSDPDKTKRNFEAMMQMKKIDLSKFE